MKRLEGQVALITGAGSGIGAAIAKALSDEGANVALCGRHIESLKLVAKELKTETQCLVCDVKEEPQLRKATEEAANHFGRLDILVNNAGIFGLVPFEEMSTEFLDDVLSTNLRGAFLSAQSAWPHLKKTKGQIVNVSSVAATQGFKECSAYCASKHGMNGLSEVLAIEGKPHGIRVFSVCPGSVDTPLWQKLETKEVLAKMMRPEDIAEMVRYLVTTSRSVEIGKIVITNFQSPWS